MELEWECFGGPKFSCTKKETSCGKCDGKAKGSEITFTGGMDTRESTIMHADRVMGDGVVSGRLN